MLDIGRNYQLDAESLCNEWVAHSTRGGDLTLNLDTLDQWEGQLIKNSRKTPSSKNTKKFTSPSEDMMTFAEDDLDDM